MAEDTAGIPFPIPDSGYQLKVFVAFSGPRLARKGILSYFAVAHNNVSPRLVLFPDRIEYRVIFRKQRSFSEIEEVRARNHPGGSIFGDVRQLTFAFKGSIWEVTFVLEKSVSESLLELFRTLAIVVRADD